MGRADPSRVGRESRLELDGGDDGRAPLLSVLGGKLTGYRLLAERALAALARFLPAGGGRPWTAQVPLPGGDLPEADYFGGDEPDDGLVSGRLAAWIADLRRRHGWLPPDLAERYGRLYGCRAEALIGDAHGLADLGCDWGGGLTERELCWLRDQEFADSASDVLWRRTGLGLVLSAAQRSALAERLGG